jgi:hypothetical protein
MLWTIAKAAGLAALLNLVAVTSPWWMTQCVSGSVLAMQNMAADDDDEDDQEKTR